MGDLTDDDLDEILRYMNYTQIRAEASPGTRKRVQLDFTALSSEARINLKASINQAWTDFNYPQVVGHVALAARTIS